MKTFLTSYKKVAIGMMIISCMVTSSCEKFVDVDAPNSQLVSETAFTSDNTVKSTLAGLYSSFAITSASSLQLDLSFATGCSADETITTASPTYDPFINHAIPPDNTTNYAMWTRLYVVIYQANSLIEGVNNNKGGISDAVKAQAIGEAKFIRAFCYFNLVNLWGDVPLALTTSQAVNSTLPRSPKGNVYQQIVADLTEAKNLLLADYSYAAGQRIRANKYAATAMLARVYLYMGDWANAEANASAVINTTATFSLLSTVDIANVFVKNNSEAIFQLDAPQSGASGDGYTYEGLNYPVSSATVPTYRLTNALISAFEAGDRRFTSWVGVSTFAGGPYYYPFKFKNKVANKTATGEYVTYLRLAEQYLIRAEARAQLNNLSAATEDVNVIRRRANLGNIAVPLKPELLLGIEQERRIEFFCEYGQRWNDLRRTGRASVVLASTPNWTANALLYPIPKNDLNNNPNLVQNPGYN